MTRRHGEKIGLKFNIVIARSGEFDESDLAIPVLAKEVKPD